MRISKALVLFTLFTSLSHTSATALTIPLDPGLPGESFTEKTFDFTNDLISAGVVADGSALTLDFEFIDMRHVEVDLGPSLPSPTAVLAHLEIFWESQLVQTLVDDPAPFLSGPMSTDKVASNYAATAHFQGGLTAKPGVVWTFNDYPDPFRFHGVHETLTLSTGLTGDTPSVVSATLRILVSEKSEPPLRVGQWVPEPTSLVVMGCGLVLVGIPMRSRRYQW